MPKVRRIGSRVGTSQAPESDPVVLDEWPPVDIDALTPQRREIFLRRKTGIELYFAGASEAELRASCDFGRSHIYRLIKERCLAPHPDGDIFGWRGALPHLRVTPWTRQSTVAPSVFGTGSSGALQTLFASPSGRTLEERFTKEILGKRPALEVNKRPKQSLFAWFIRELRAAGFERRGEWPFNVEKLGYVTISRHIDRVLDANPKRRLQLDGGEDALRKAKAGDGTKRPALAAFQRVECDAHKIDAHMVVMVPSPHGGHEPRRVMRLWIIVILDVASRCALGYHLSLRRECGADDVLRAIKHALSEWRPIDLQFSQQAYVPGAALPSGHDVRYVGACWDEFSVDGALANVCKRVETPLREIVGSVVIKPQDPTSYSSRRSKDDRPFIESFFRQLSTSSMHRLSATTGASPRAIKGRNPMDTANRVQFQLEYAQELLDTLIANYNVTPHSGLGYRSPLAQLDFLTRRDCARIRQADAGAVRRIVTTRKLCTLLGGIDSGRRPYFNFANARYSAEWLCLRTDLLGKTLWLQIENENDARWAAVSTQRGEFIGVLRAAPPWHLTPHTLYMRQAIRSLDKRRLIHLSSSCDAVEELIRYAESADGQKLPVHPAYLEARRVFQQHALTLANDPITSPRSDPPGSLAEARDPRRTASRADPRTAPAPAEVAAQAETQRVAQPQLPPDARPVGRPVSQPALPRMRMAKTW